MKKPKVAGDGPVLMIDDQDADILIARRCYERAGLDNEFVAMPAGQDLLDHIDKVRRGEAPMPALVLLDINMPAMDGFTVLSKVRALEGFDKLPRILMLTNSDRSEDIERSKQLGADGFATKPLRVVDYVAFFASLAV